MIKWDLERPRWLQLMEILRGRIQDGTYRGKIPSFKQLVQEFELGINTVKHAVDALAEQGYVRKVESLGTFVRPPQDWPER
ncbi:GntR family transcriptional regulator [Nonomuraea sp. NPDC003804]|uniref:GntR family transcriptional regulator n=1 Tax=Nonomuraea sp. NPDC003804 TaxID=3154547 RepID=UPI0033B815B8